MRTPFAWTLPSQVSLQAVCACYALWGAPAVGLAASEQIMPPPAVATPAVSTASPAAPTSTTNSGTARIGDAVFNRRVLTLVALGCVVGTIIGWVRRSPHVTGVRLLHKPKKMRLSVLVPPTPAPRLVPGDSPNATRARSIRAPLPRQTPAGAPRSGAIDYIAAFADPGKARGGSRVDYLLVSSDSEEESPEAPGGFDGSPRDTE
jgi:hypothetical protein